MIQMSHLTQQKTGQTVSSLPMLQEVKRLLKASGKQTQKTL